MTLHQFLRLCLALGAALLLPLLAVPAASAADGSFPGCPLLVEDNPGNPVGCVKTLQTSLNASAPGPEGYDLTPDGKFGRLTRIAVLDFQGRNHLPADGNVGPVTANALLDQTSVGTPSPSDCDIHQGYVSDGNGGCKYLDPGAAVPSPWWSPI